MVKQALILVMNCGSSSIKTALFDTENISAIVRLHLKGIGSPDATLRHNDSARSVSCPDYQTAIKLILETLDQTIERQEDIVAVGHRVPHGGSEFTVPTIIDNKIEKQIEKLGQLAPLHNPISLLGISTVRQWLGHCPHIAVFDTAFHSSLPNRARDYAIPEHLIKKHGIRRYGFHGTSHQDVNKRTAKFLQAPANSLRIVSCHLGSGCSLAAIENGRSVETSMGMTPLEGLVMGSRSGDLDPGIIIELMRQEDLDANSLDKLLNQQSGLLGITGTQNMANIEQRASEGDESCRRALHLFCHRARKYLGAYAAVMGGVDAIVFTGGIGENSAYIRHRIGQRLEYLGAVIDEDLNRDASLDMENNIVEISTNHSRVKILVVAADEEHAIAEQVGNLISVDNKDNLLESRHPIPISVSARHVHLCPETIEQLFGPGHRLKEQRPLSQPGQFAAKEVVTLVGPRGTIENVRILGPERTQDQVEISRSDEFTLGIDAPIRASGDLQHSPGIKLIGPAGEITIPRGVICAMRHIHMTPQDAQIFGVQDGDRVEVTVGGKQRDLTYREVLIRVDENFKLEMHIDTDEANAAELNTNDLGILMPVSAKGRLRSKQP